jgi:hypothetical protein
VSPSLSLWEAPELVAAGRAVGGQHGAGDAAGDGAVIFIVQTEGDLHVDLARAQDQLGLDQPGQALDMPGQFIGGQRGASQ